MELVLLFISNYICRLIKEIEDIVKGPLFAQIGCTIIVLCATAFQLITVVIII